MRVLLCLWLLAATDPLPEGSDPAGLVARLGSARFTERESAGRDLERLGRGAIAALRAASASPDAEVRARASSILGRIEGALLVEPTMVALDFDDARLVDALATINRRSGLKLTLTPEFPALWDDRRVSLRSARPLPFWEAVDALCDAGQVHSLFGGQGDFEHGDPTFVLHDGLAISQGRFHDHGPFRVQLTSLQYQSEVHLASDRPLAGAGAGAERDPSHRIGPPAEAATRQFFLQMQVGAEPRLLIAPAGPARVLEATDEQGRPLAVPPPQEMVQRDSGYLGVNASPLVHLRVDLIYPDRPVARLKRVRGTIPLQVSTRRPDPLEVPLAGASGRTFSHGGVALSVGEVRPGQADQPGSIDLTLRVGRAEARPADGDDDEAGAIRSLVSPQRLEVLDAQGHSIPWFPSSTAHHGEGAALTLTLFERKGPAVPTTLRFHDLISDRTEVPFEFRDLPMP